MEKRSISVERRLSGTLYSYYGLCPRKAWLFAHGLGQEQDNWDVQLGKVLDETAYARERHQVQIDGCICIDYLKKNVVYEVKKSDRLEEAAVRQVKYYLFVLREKGILAEGQISYPLLKKCTKVELTETDCEQIRKDTEKIIELVDLANPPERIEKKICPKCAYYELCTI